MSRYNAHSVRIKINGPVGKPNIPLRRNSTMGNIDWDTHVGHALGISSRSKARPIIVVCDDNAWRFWPDACSVNAWTKHCSRGRIDLSSPAHPKKSVERSVVIKTHSDVNCKDVCL